MCFSFCVFLCRSVSFCVVLRLLLSACLWLRFLSASFARSASEPLLAPLLVAASCAPASAAASRARRDSREAQSGASGAKTRKQEAPEQRSFNSRRRRRCSEREVSQAKLFSPSVRSAALGRSVSQPSAACQSPSATSSMLSLAGADSRAHKSKYESTLPLLSFLCLRRRRRRRCPVSALPISSAVNRASQRRSDSPEAPTHLQHGRACVARRSVAVAVAAGHL